MMLLDSNIIIYAAKPEHGALRQFIAEHSPALSAVSYLEVLGYHKLSEADRLHFQAFFACADVIPLSQPVLDQAVALRRQRKMTLGDSLVAGTALAFHHDLVTRNTKDFDWIDKTGEGKYNLSKKVYEFTLIDSQDKSRVFTGNMDKDYLVLESVDPTTKDTYRWKMNLAAEGVRLIYTFDKKADGKTLFSTEYQVASSRAGESLGPKAKQERECVVSGGLGTGQVTFQGKSYWICCSGCRDAFAVNPEKYVKEFEAKRKN
jgi:predicted nucleic acid-binding protein